MRKKMASTAQPVEVSLAKKARRDVFAKLCRESPKGFPGSFYLFQRRSSHFLP